MDIPSDLFLRIIRFTGILIWNISILGNSRIYSKFIFVLGACKISRISSQRLSLVLCNWIFFTDYYANRGGRLLNITVELLSIELAKILCESHLDEKDHSEEQIEALFNNPIIGQAIQNGFDLLRKGRW